mgnify:CR=1 FL=1
MPLLNYDFANTPEIKPLPAGEYYVILRSLEETTSKSSGAPMLKAHLEIEDAPFANDVFHNIMLPAPTDTTKDAARKVNRLRDFVTVFGGSTSGPVDTATLIGSRALVRLKFTSDPQFGDKNEVEAWLRPA